MKDALTGIGRPLKTVWPMFFFGMLAVTFLAPPQLDGQRRLAPRPIPYSELDREEGKERLQRLREFSFPTVYAFRFDVRVMPRRGEETRLSGKMWGSRDAAGPVVRYEIENHSGDPLRYLVRGGYEPEIWKFDSTGVENSGVEQLGVRELFTPVAETDFSPFDLQMPFLFWTEFDYEGLRRVRARSAHTFLMHPPPEIGGEFPSLHGVRLFLDAEFNAPLGADLLGEDQEVMKTFRIDEVKRLGDDWLVRSIDYRDEVTGSRTRMIVQEAALGLPEEKFDFSPDALTEPFPGAPSESFRSL